MTDGKQTPPSVAVIGGGPTGLMAAEVLSRAGVPVDLYEAMPSVGRKFLLAGVGGMNITHSEPAEAFLGRYGSRAEQIAPLLQGFDAQALRDWVHDLGVETFVGSSGRVFPTDMKAAPLLRAWLRRLRAAGVRLHMRHRWLGWDEQGALRIQTPTGEVRERPAAVILALGGGSWPRLGSDAAWVPWLRDRDIAVAPLQPANCGFEVTTPLAQQGWSTVFRERFAGAPVKPVAVRFQDVDGHTHVQQGEFVITEQGVEGSLIYALSARLRDALAATGEVGIELDLTPGRALERLTQELSRPRGKESMAAHLRRRAGIDGVKVGLLRELVSAADFAEPMRLARAVKALPLRLIAPFPLAGAISTAGGVEFAALDEQLMLRSLPGVFCAGEMLDWEAPTGGYLLTACFASGRAAGQGALHWLRSSAQTRSDK